MLFAAVVVLIVFFFNQDSTLAKVPAVDPAHYDVHQEQSTDPSPGS